MLARTDRLKLAAQPVAAPPVPLIAPIRGWNTRDALDAMDEADAVLLDNWYPDANGVNVRNGFISYATGMGNGLVQTLATYSAGSTNKLLAAAEDAIFDVSSSGPVGAALGTGFNSSQWQSVLFLSRLFLFNGTDQALIYNGSSLTNPSFTGVALNTLVGGIIYQNRLFCWATNSTGFYYAPLNSISGALNFFDLAAFSPHGGNLIAAATYSHDGGNGVLDFVCFIMSSGDCLIFYGNDPGDVNNWQLIGIYRISPPVSPRAVCNYGAEAFLTTGDDHVQLQQILASLKDGRLPPRSKVSTAVQAAVNANANGQGWQALYYPAGRRLIFNIPSTDGTFSQHVQNTGVTYQDPFTGMPASPWCRFKGMNAACWGLFNNNLYFGGTPGTVYQADFGTLDGNAAVQANAQQAWNMFKNPLRKRITAARPLIETLSGVTFNFGLGFDYGDIDVAVDGVIPAAGAPWDVSPWDTTPWSPTEAISTLWHAAGGDGVAVSAALAVAATQGAAWLRTDFRYEEGMAL